jgi:hypothetical protein
VIVVDGCADASPGCGRGAGDRDRQWFVEIS